MKERRVTFHRVKSGISKKAAAVGVLILAATMILGISAPCVAESEPLLQDKVVVIIVDRVSPSDFPTEETPFCYELADKWSFGLMVTRVSYGTDVEDSLGAAYVTLGSGVRARGATTAGLSFGADELYEGYRGLATAGEYYSLYSGRVVSSEGIVSLGWNEVVRNNEKDGNDENAGLLGDLLAQREKKVAVIGNADSLSGPMRLAPLACCDSVGRVPYGDVGNGYTVPSPDSIGGYRIDPEQLGSTALEYLEKTDIVFVDTGDTARIDAEYDDTNKSHLEEERRDALGRVDAVVEKIGQSLDFESSMMLIVTPRAPLEARGEGNFLTPFIAAGKGFGDGLVTSTTTRQPGLVDNSDFLPTVLKYYRLKTPSSVNGNPIAYTASSESPALMLEAEEQFGVTRKARWPVAVIGLSIMLILAALMVLCLPGVNARISMLRHPERTAKLIGPLVTILLTFPIFIFISAGFRYDNFLFPTIFCLVLSTVSGLLVWKLQKGRKRLDPLVSIALLTAGVIVVDLLMGENLISVAPLGSTSLEGMRYFGFTNTVASVLLSCTVWAIAGLVGNDAFKPGWNRVLSILFMVAVSLIIGLGVLGANVGGFITAVTTFLVYIYTGSKERIGKLALASIPAIAVAGLTVIVLLDALFFHSHAGKAVGTGSGNILGIIGRKIAIEISAMRGLSVPVLIVIAILFALVLWMRQGRSPLRTAQERFRPQFTGFYSLLVGGLVAVLTNDTGFLMLGFMLSYSVVCACFYASEWIVNQPGPEDTQDMSLGVLKA